MAEQETKRERSAIYPYATWNECVEFIKRVDSFRASQVSYEEMAKKFGVTPQAFSFKAKLSTSKQFGLIDTAGNVISLSSIAKKLLYPTGNNESEIVYECFKSPPLYSRLIELYNGKALPTEVVLSNVLMNDHRIARNAKDAAAKYFLLNATEMGFVRAGVLAHSIEDTAASLIDPQELSCDSTENKPSDTPPVTFQVEPAPNFLSRENEYITQIVPTESGKSAKIQIPLDATEDDLWLIRDTLDVIMKRKFKIKLE